jgi:large subunit ribosomal protein L6
MSRIGKQSIEVPAKVEVSIDGQKVTVKGPKGTLEHVLPELISIEQDGNVLQVNRANETRQARSLHGLSRSLVANMVTGVSTGFSKELEIRGVGYRAQSSGSKVTLNLGFSHPIIFECPEGVSVEVENNTKLTVSGYDKQKVGQAAATIRSYRPPEPYKGKGVRYADEYVAQKEGKSA